MAGVPPAALLLGAAAAFMLLRKKDEPTSGAGADLPEPEDSAAPDSTTPNAPQVKTQDELEAELEETEEATRDEVRAALQWRSIPSGYDIPVEMEHNELWVSEDCEAAAMGRDWSPVIEVDGTLYDPAAYWREWGGGVRPNQGAQSSSDPPQASSVMQFTIMAIMNHSPTLPCRGEIPRPEDYSTHEEYATAWTDFKAANPGMSGRTMDERGLFDEIYYNHVTEPMMAAWHDEDPEAWTDYKLDQMAAWAVREHPNEDLTEQTDQAYFEWIKDDSDAPRVIDPQNPAHNYYKELWLSLREAIQDL
jgi:hypothetical protein